MIILCIVIAILCVIIFAMLEWEGMTTVAFASVFVLGIVSCNQSDWYQADLKAQAEEARRDAIPHVIREADGCKVYAFKTDREHYFTRCGSTVTTDTNYSVYCGKGCRKEETESIVTEGNK